MHPSPRPARFRHTIPLLWALAAVSASLARSLPGADAQRFAGDGRAALPLPRPGQPLEAGLTEARLHEALPGKTLIRVGPGEWQRIASLQSSEGRLITGPALAALVSGASAPGASPAEPTETASGADRVARGPAQAPAAVRDSALAASPAAACRQADSLLRARCLDSLSRASAPRALREMEARREAASVTEDPAAAPDAVPDDVQAARNQGYLAGFFADMGHGGDWDWDLDEWAVVIYVVVGVIVVGAFVLWGAKALYDLAVNDDDSPVFKEAALQFSYSGRSLRDRDGAALFRDAYLMGGRFAFGVEKPYLSLGLAVEGGSIDLSVRALETSREIVEARGGYLVGGPLVRFGRYRPLAFTLEFLNGTSNHSSIGWISKSRMTLAAKTRGGFIYGAHLGAVFYDLRFTDGLVLRRGDFNRDLSLLMGLDAGWAF